MLFVSFLFFNFVAYSVKKQGHISKLLEPSAIHLDYLFINYF